MLQFTLVDLDLDYLVLLSTGAYYNTVAFYIFLPVVKTYIWTG